MPKLYAMVESNKSSSFLSIFATKEAGFFDYSLSKINFFKDLCEAKKECESNLDSPVKKAIIEMEIKDNKISSSGFTLHEITGTSVGGVIDDKNSTETLILVSLNNDVVSQKEEAFDEDSENWVTCEVVCNWIEKPIAFSHISKEVREKINEKWEEHLLNSSKDKTFSV